MAAGGLGGTDLGGNIGTAGGIGNPGTFTSLGTIVFVDPLQITGVGLAANSATNQTNLLTNPNTAPSTEEIEKRDKENKQKREAAVCK